VTGAGPSDSQAPTTLLSGNALEWFAVLYRRCASAFHWLPCDVDRHEVWEIGAALGVATEDVEQWAADRPDISGPGVQSVGRDLVAERVLAHREGKPQPEAPVMNMSQVGMLQERLRVS
jgi:hypothetical protein